MKQQRRSRVDGNMDESVDCEPTIDQIGLAGSEVSGRRQRGVVQNYHILPPSGNSHFLGHAIGNELDVVFQILGLILISRIEQAFHEDIDAIVATHLNIVELIAFDTINVKKEMPLALSCHSN